MCILAKMTASMTNKRVSTIAGSSRGKYSRNLWSESLLDAEHVSQRRQASLEVELRALCQERRLTVIIKFEKGSVAFDSRLHETRRGDLEQICLCQRGTERGKCMRAQAEHGGRGLTTEDEMPQFGEDGRV